MVDEVDIHLAYKYILGRGADQDGLTNYKSQASRGMTLDQLRRYMITSDEFANNLPAEKSRVVQVGNVKVVVDPTEPEFGAVIAHHRTWEPHIVELIRANLSAGDIYVDIGANVGVMSMTAADIVGPSGKVLAFEPHPENVQYFLKGIAANSFSHVKLHGFALSDNQGVFSIVGSSNGYLASADEAAYQCVSITGDSVLLDEPKISFIKIDIEGHEPQALSGMSKTIEQHKPKILCEFNPRCLKDHIGCPPPDFARQLFSIAKAMTVIEHDGKRSDCQSADELMDMWNVKNAEAVRDGHLPDGMVHFDLLMVT
jgi:FkbM family methyltransferase